jgi:RHS repeat-associated protein
MTPGNLAAGGSEPGYAFTGREWDPETGLYYYRARYLDARAGRFISEDRLEADEPEGESLYSYVDSDPVSAIDPSGWTKMVVTNCGKDRKRVERAAKKARKAI